MLAVFKLINKTTQTTNQLLMNMFKYDLVQKYFILFQLKAHLIILKLVH